MNNPEQAQGEEANIRPKYLHNVVYVLSYKSQNS
jgi:hypothetical protein